MTKLQYTNDQQIINDAAQLIIKGHLNMSRSDEEMPSRDFDNIAGLVIRAYLAANNTEDASESEQQLLAAEAHHLAKQAKHLADRKWEAAMTLLGIEA